MLPRLVFAAIALGLTGLILWAMRDASLSDSVARMLADPWGVVTLADLYAGFAAAAILMALVEKPRTAVVLFLALLVLGNVVTFAWLAWRGWDRLRTQ